MQVKAILQALIFYLSCFILGFLLGAWIGGSFLVPSDAGLAGGAMVVGYGLMGAVAGLVVAYVLQRHLNSKQYVQAVWIAAILSLIGLAGLTYRYATNRSPAEPIRPPVTGQTSEATTPAAQLVHQTEQQAIGMGIARPPLFPPQTLYFYGPPNLDRTPQDTPPYDSITFQQNEHYTDIAYAPPWFFPEFTKLDYDMLLLRVVSIHQDWLEVIVNRQTGRTAWLDRRAVSWQEWPSFLLGVYAVEPLQPGDSPMRVKPLDHAGYYSNPPDHPWQALTIKGDWMQIRGGGWIRWRKCEDLLVQYVLLS